MDNYFKYSKKYINNKIKEFKDEKCGKAVMIGVRVELEKLKGQLEQFYTENVFHLSAFEGDAPFMGWNTSDPEYLAMLNTVDEITEMFSDIYALILVGLNEEMT